MSPKRGAARALERLFPESQIDGYTRIDGTVTFFTRVNSLLTSEARVLDYGAGRGEWLQDSSVTRRNLRNLRLKVAEVVGIDIDAAVSSNESLDRALVIKDGAPLPFP